jgi:hypothetical protein
MMLQSVLNWRTGRAVGIIRDHRLHNSFLESNCPLSTGGP